MFTSAHYPSQPPKNGTVLDPSGCAKQHAVFRKIAQSRYDTLPPWRAPWEQPRATAVSLLRIALDPAFQKNVVDAPYHTRGDERPEREKLFHRLGACATCEFVPVADTHFAGVLAQATPGVMRLSLATTPELYAPGIAIKLFRPGDLESVNFLAAPSLDPQKSRDFFAHAAHTTVPAPTDPLARAFFSVLGARHPPYSLDVRTAMDQGDACAVVPEVLTFEPLQHLGVAEHRDLRTALEELPVGEKLWSVHANHVPVGSIWQTSRFMSSVYGDRILHFAHA